MWKLKLYNELFVLHNSINSIGLFSDVNGSFPHAWFCNILHLSFGKYWLIESYSSSKCQYSIQYPQNHVSISQPISLGLCQIHNDRYNFSIKCSLESSNSTTDKKNLFFFKRKVYCS